MRCSRLVVRHSSFVVRRRRFVVHRSSFVVRCSSSSFVVRRSSFVVRRSLFVGGSSPFVGGGSSFAVRRSLFVGGGSSFVGGVSSFVRGGSLSVGRGSSEEVCRSSFVVRHSSSEVKHDTAKEVGHRPRVMRSPCHRDAFSPAKGREVVVKRRWCSSSQNGAGMGWCFIGPTSRDVQGAEPTPQLTAGGTWVLKLDAVVTLKKSTLFGKPVWN